MQDRRPRGWLLCARRFAVWPAVSAGYLLAFFATHYTLWRGDRFLGWDAVRESWGDLLFAYKALAQGSLPLWNTFERGGYPFAADPQTAVFYPLNWLVYLGAAFFGQGCWLALLRTLLHVLVGALGVHYLLRRMRSPAPAQWLGGLSFVLSARVAKSKDNAGLWSAVWLPWMLIALDETTRRPSVRAGLGLGLATGMCFCSGYPPNLFRNLVALAVVFGATLIWMLRRRVVARRDYLLRLLRALTVAVAVATGLALPNFLATLELLPHVVRSELSLAEVLRSALAAGDAVQLLVPRLVSKHVYPYMGQLPMVLAVLAIIWRPTRQRLVLGVLAAIFFLLSCGQHGLLLPLLTQVAGVFRMWRIPEQYLFVMSTCLAILGGLGLADLCQATTVERGRLRRLGLVLFCVTFLLALSGLVAGHWGKQPALVRSAAIAAILAIAGALLLLALTDQRAGIRRLAGFGVVLVLLVDLGLQLRPVYDILEPTPQLSRDKAVAQLALSQRQLRLADDNYFGWRVGVRHSLREFFGRHSTMIGRRFRDYYRRARENPRLLAAANVGFYAGRNATRLKRLRPGSVLRDGVVELGDVAPRAYWVADAEVLADANAVLAELGRGSWRRALLEQNELQSRPNVKVSQGSSRQRAIAARVTRSDQQSVELVVEAPADGWVVLTESYYPGWQVWVDDQAAELVRANYLFCAVRVTAGEHELHFRYRPRWVSFGLLSYALTWLIAIIVLFGSWWRGKLGQSDPASSERELGGTKSPA